jgi:NitT/TauT family transport system permease protein
VSTSRAIIRDLFGAAKLRRRAGALALAILLLALWQEAVVLLKVPSYILPTPTAVVGALVNGLKAQLYGPHVAATLAAMLVGYGIGVGTGIIVGALLAEFRALERTAFPYIVAIQSVPKIALAPLFVMWLGYGLSSKVVMVALICFFPMVVNTMTGIASADRDRVDIVTTMTATRWQIFWHVRLPSAAGSIFAGLQVSVVLALIGALVAEFVGSDAGLGNLIQASQAALDTAGMFAVLVILAVIGIITTGLVRLAHRRIVFWETGTRVTTET